MSEPLTREEFTRVSEKSTERLLAGFDTLAERLSEMTIAFTKQRTFQRGGDEGDKGNDWRTLALFVTLLCGLATITLSAINVNSQSIQYLREHDSAAVQVLQSGQRRLYQVQGDFDKRLQHDIDLKVAPLVDAVSKIEKAIGAVTIMERLDRLQNEHNAE